MFRVRNVPAALYKALGGFATNGVNMTKLECYQLGGSFFATQFYAEIDGHPADRLVRLAMEELAFFTSYVRVLGTYKASPARAEVAGRGVNDDVGRYPAPPSTAVMTGPVRGHSPAPLPLVGRGWGWGSKCNKGRRSMAVAHCGWLGKGVVGLRAFPKRTPTPDPSPQGGGEPMPSPPSHHPWA